ncbi:hypothetical protein Nepgr_014687 [Nepenthes gracilis]|uniref:Uncharacterized protein n=1 Tax=Nepenthes gracilis TaxID=150966 RepID=A0AAD3SLI9_NEPGR|nr:hypothetical protein Nepgr_014687 [Nepenthes gracilis]
MGVIFEMVGFWVGMDGPLSADIWFLCLRFGCSQANCSRLKLPYGCSGIVMELVCYGNVAVTFSLCKCED